MESVCHVVFLGGLDVYCGSRPLRFATRKTSALFAFLAYHAGKTFLRDSLADRFWPECETEQARNSLRVALSGLRKNLETADERAAGILQADRMAIGMQADILTSDVAEFRQIIRDARRMDEPAQRVGLFLRAVNLYRGPLLYGWYEDWIEPEQNRLAEAYGDALRQLSRLYAAVGELERAVEFARRVVQVEPLNEDGHATLMNLYARQGRRESAVRQYRELERLLTEEMGVVPSRTMRELLDRIQREPMVVPVGNPPQASAPMPAPGVSSAEKAHPAPPETAVPVVTFASAFFGREGEVRRLVDLLEPGLSRKSAARLVTLTGPGGVGKTRLAFETAQRLRRTAYAEQVWFVSLENADSPEQKNAAIAAVLPQSSETGARPPENGLLVLDGLEAEQDGIMGWVSGVQKRYAGLTLLLTARQPLGLPGERTFAVLPLPVPDEGEAISEADLSRWPGVQLFLERALAARPDFPVTDRSMAEVALLCRRLDGLPLAIELAASWSGVLTAEQMRERLTDRFALLVSQDGRVPARHRSLRTVLDDSHRTLADDLRVFAGALSVFRGGWTLDDAEAVCDSEDTLAKLALLQKRSFLFTVESEAGVRFHLLESVREYARSLLTDARYAEIQRRHAAHFARVAEQYGPQVNSCKAAEATACLAANAENFAAALRRSLGTLDEPVVAVRLAAALWRHWFVARRIEDGDGFLRAALDAAPEETPWQVQLDALEGAGRFALHQGHATRACGLFEEALDLARTHPDTDKARLETLAANLSLAAEARGETAKMRETDKFRLALKMRTGDPWSRACILNRIARATETLEGEAAAHRWYEQERQLLDILGMPRGNDVSTAGGQELAYSLLWTGWLALEQGDYQESVAPLEEAVALFERAGNQHGVAVTLVRLGMAYLRMHEWERAWGHLERVLALRRAGVGPLAEPFSRRLLAQAARGLGDAYAQHQLLSDGAD